MQHRIELTALDQLVVTALLQALNAATTLGERAQSMRMPM